MLTYYEPITLGELPGEILWGGVGKGRIDFDIDGTSKIYPARVLSAAFECRPSSLHGYADNHVLMLDMAFMVTRLEVRGDNVVDIEFLMMATSKGMDLDKVVPAMLQYGVPMRICPIASVRSEVLESGLFETVTELNVRGFYLSPKASAA